MNWWQWKIPDFPKKPGVDLFWTVDGQLVSVILIRTRDTMGEYVSGFQSQEVAPFEGSPTSVKAREPTSLKKLF